MTPLVLHLVSLSAKIALLGGLAWIQLHLLRRAPAASRSRLCSLALIAIVLFAAGEIAIAPSWRIQAPVFHFTAAAALQATSAASPSSIFWAGLVWMAGAAFMLLRAIAGRVALAHLHRRSTLLVPASDLDVYIGPVETPILIGLLRPVILLPAAARTWTHEQRRMVVTHELTHLRQGDCWSNLLAQILRAAFWFHPVVWLLVARLSREQELTCDEAVVASGHSPHDYAAFLLDTVRNLRSRQMFACAMAGSGASSLKRRFANLLDTTPRRILNRRLTASIALFAALATMLAVVRPVWSQTENSKGKVYRVGHGVLPPKLLTKVNPDYTQEAKDAKIEGTDLLHIVVTPEGKPEQIEVVRGIDPGLDRKAMEALSQWTFQPATRNGKPVAVKATVEINFRLK